VRRRPEKHFRFAPPPPRLNSAPAERGAHGSNFPGQEEPAGRDQEEQGGEHRPKFAVAVAAGPATSRPTTRSPVPPVPPASLARATRVSASPKKAPFSCARRGKGENRENVWRKAPSGAARARSPWGRTRVGTGENTLTRTLVLFCACNGPSPQFTASCDIPVKKRE
jgi:hypothetical protein